MVKDATKKAKAVEKPVEAKAKGGKAGKGSKMPKTIAGVKIPKSLRESASSIISLIETPLGRQILADVLIAAAGALVADRSRETASAPAKAAPEASAEAARQILPTSMTASVGEDAPAKDAKTPSKPARKAKTPPAGDADAAPREIKARTAKAATKTGRARGA